jgi:hypothetical protein
MKLYLAGFYASNFNLQGNVVKKLTEPELQARLSIEHNLESYHYIYRQSAVDKIRGDGKKVFLDSGAFSAYTKGVTVNIPAYCEYVTRNWDIIEMVDDAPLASVLDGIGDPLLTYQNQMTMHRLGVPALPCYHYGEDPRYLDWYIENYSYITLGGMVPISTMQLVHWLDRIWEEHLCDSDGKPKVKVHGFGLTSLPLMKRYPWYSVDSSTWVQWSANGMLLVPGVGQVNVSSKSSSRKIEGQHLNTYTAPQREAIISHIRGLGFDPDRLANEYVSRWAFNAWAFQEEGRRSTLTHFKRPQPELF